MAIDINGDGLIQLGGTSTTQGRVRLNEDTDNGTNYIELTAPASVTSNKTITLPDETGTVITTATTTGINASAISTGTLAVANGGTGANTLTAEAVIIGNTTSTVKSVSPGTNGNVLTSNGTAWLSVAPAGTGANTQSFTSSGTWTKPSGATVVMVLLWGGGGSGGRDSAGGGGGGGGGGELTSIIIPAVLLPSTVSVTIGAGATAPATNNNGNQGGSTTFGTYSDAVGGFGGPGGSSSGSTGAPGGGRYLCGGFWDGTSNYAVVSCGIGGSSANSASAAGTGYKGSAGSPPLVRSDSGSGISQLVGTVFFNNTTPTNVGLPLGTSLKAYAYSSQLPFTNLYSYGGAGGGGSNASSGAGGAGGDGLLAGAGGGGGSDTGTGGTGGTSSQITSFSGFTSVGGNGGTNGGTATNGSGVGAGGGGSENTTAGNGSNGACVVYSW